MKFKRIISFVLIFLLIFSLFISEVNAAVPTVTTNDATGVEETNATLNEYLDDDGGEQCDIAGFDYGLTNGYGSTWTSDNSYVYAGGGTTNKVYQYWKSNMTKKAETASYGGTIKAIAEDSTYIYVGGMTTQKVYQYWKSNMTLKTMSANYGGTIWTITVDLNYIYAGGGTQKVYQYWKSNLTFKAMTADYGGTINALVQDSTYVYVGGWTTNKVYQYWKSNMTKKAETASYGGNIYNLVQDYTYIYVGGDTTSRVCQYWKSNLTYKAQTGGGQIIYGLAIDNTYIYAGGDGQKVYQYWKSNLTLKASTPSYGGDIRPLTQDSTYIYAGGDTTNKVYQYWKSNLTKKTETLTYGGAIYALSSSNIYFTGDTFSYDATGLIPGKLYHFRAFATNSIGTGYGSDREFLTKPIEPASLTATANTTNISLTWTKGTGANNTYIERNTISSWARGAGTLVYNTTGTSCKNSGLAPGTLYYYHAWSYAKWNTSQQWSDINISSYALTKPEALTNSDLKFVSVSGVNIIVNLTWTKGTGANRTVLLMKTTGGTPTSITDGTIIYNGTGTYKVQTLTIGTTYFFRAWSYSSWIAPALHQFSVNSTAFTNSTGGLFINCYDETTHANITFTVMVSNLSGSSTYSNTGCTNTHVINSSLCPQDIGIQIIVSATGYQQRIYTIDIYPNIFYVLNAYLPLVTSNGSGGVPPGGDTSGCVLRGYIDSMTITNPAVDATITFTYALEDMISVEIYNSTLYGSYGGWLFVSSDKYAFTSAHVIINETVLDANTTMVKASYYYEFCTGGVESALYNIRVVETVQTEYTQVDQAVENAFMIVKRYINTSGIFVIISSIYTDANGYINIYLVPNAHYKVFISKTGYDNTTGDYIPAPPNEWGQTIEKWFRIVKTTTTPEYNITYGFWDLITFNATMYSNNSIKVIFIDHNLNTTNAQFYTYELYNFTSTLISTNTTTSDSFAFWITGINTSRMHRVNIFLNHTILGSKQLSIPVSPINYSGALNVPAIEKKITDVFGSFDLGFIKFFLIYLPAIVILILPGKFHPGFGIIGSGLWMGFAAIRLSISPEMAVLIPFIIAIGILLMLVKEGGVKL
jgi:hypothetical protein